METDAPRPIDAGARYLARVTAPDWPRALEVLEKLTAACPADAYPLRGKLRKSNRGARVDVEVIYQRKGMPLPGEGRDG